MNRRLKCAIVDDDPFSIEVLKSLCSYSSLAEATYCFTSPGKFLSSLKGLEFDVCLFDVVMPGVDGITLSTKVNGKPVILCTGEESMLKQATSAITPIDVINKPIEKYRFERAIEKASKFLMREASPQHDKLFYVAEMKGQVKVKACDILFVTTDEIDHRNKRVFLKSGQIYTIMNCTLNQLQSFANSLIRVNKSELVASEAIHKVEYDLITLDGIKENNKIKQISLSRLYRKEFIGKYASI